MLESGPSGHIAAGGYRSRSLEMPAQGAIEVVEKLVRERRVLGDTAACAYRNSGETNLCSTEGLRGI